MDSKTTRNMKHLNVIGLAILTLLSSASSHADEVAIRKTIAERLPAFPKIDEISRTPVHGIYELRVGTDVTVYTFLYPVLGKDSREKSRDIWCAKDKALAWR